MRRNRQLPLRGRRSALLLTLTLAGCGDPPPAGDDAAADVPARFAVAGRIEDGDLDELSGIAHSGRDPTLYWVHNDSGDKARLYAIGDDGSLRGRLKLEDADNVDWEDLAAFTLAQQPYLLVADIGNNEGRRDVLTLYAVAEPALGEDGELTAQPDWSIEFRYPDGPHDAEAVAVDTEAGTVYILTKRDVPPLLFRLPLRPADDSVQTAEQVQAVTGLPPPTRRDLEFAAMTRDWHWQPTAMDFSTNGRFAIVLTYGAVYYFARSVDEDSPLAATPLRFDLRRLRNAEGLAVSADSSTLYLTVEERRPPLLRIDLGNETSNGPDIERESP